MLSLSVELIRYGVDGPIDSLQTITIVKSIKVSLYKFIYPDFLQHGVQLLTNVNIILQSKFDLLFSLEYLFVLIFE